MTYRVAVIEEHYTPGELTTTSKLVSAEEWLMLSSALVQASMFTGRYEDQGCKLSRISTGIRMATFHFTRDEEHTDTPTLLSVDIVISDQTVPLRPRVTALMSEAEQEEYRRLTISSGPVTADPFTGHPRI